MNKINDIHFIVLNVRKERSPFGKTYYTLRETGEQDRPSFDIKFDNSETVTKELLREAALEYYLRENVPQLVVQGDII